MKNNVKVILFYVLLIAAIFVAVLAMMGNPSSNEEPIFSDIMQYFEEDRVKEFEVSSENVLTLIVYKTDKAGLLMPEDVANAKTEKINYKLRDIELFRAEFEKARDGTHSADLHPLFVHSVSKCHRKSVHSKSYAKHCADNKKFKVHFVFS